MSADTTSLPSAQTRRTQAERSQETRNKVCEATLRALVDVGYAQISTPLIAKRAQVSRGALTHQFPTRNDMLVAAFEKLVSEWRDDYPFALDPDKNQLSVDELVDALWSTIFSNSHYIAAMELMLASRQNNELGRALRDILVKWIRERDRIAARLIGENADDTDAGLKVQLHLSVLRGIAIHQSFDSDPQTAKKLIELWKQMARKA
ncbi:HTH-type transcriptional regulator CymR [Sulfitobacter sp. DSM 110093]|jgi:AcrR family transcriptional regulator|uniref:TetR/AcrR family transcriptional regulator n=1 Tax=Sulfitobacter sp. DSM 110093 TaxID=2883127 RepID=UPI001FAC468E|nr:TetR/AcrR family transcriptional regulator [Sulfitobacter sp. DSM 110093]UOA33127.1 HTH-type transcriptional regulator CymR [Sulfitobacter sp. DSM 110093]